MRIEAVEVRQIRMELVRPFRTSFGTTRERIITIVRVTDGNVSGYGEVTAAEGPLFGHETFETAWHILNDFIIPWTLGKEFHRAADLGPALARIRGHRMTKAGMENALWDLEARQRGIPLWRLLGGIRDRIDCGVSIGIQPSADALIQCIQTEKDAGYQRFKVKIQPGWDVDVIRAVRESFPDIRLMVDANSAYSLDDADHLRQFDAFDLMMIEQPLDWEDIIDHATLQKTIRTPICLDESIHSAGDARKAIAIGACRIVNIKVGRVGGHSGAVAVHDVCHRAGVPVWCGGMLESGIGRAHNVAISTLPNFTLPGDVSDSRRYWTQDIVEPAIHAGGDGTIIPSGGPGLGYTVCDDRIEARTTRARSFRA